MAQKKRCNFVIDKLKIGYLQPSSLFEKLSKFHEKEFVEFENFALHIIDDGRGNDENNKPTQIMANVILADGTLLGNFIFNNSARYDGMCFFKFANSALYKPFTTIHGKKNNYITFIDSVADTLGLTINSFTEIELAADINFNVIPKIRKLIKNFAEYDMIYNGKRITDENRKLDNYHVCFGGSRSKLDRYPTLYFRQKKDEGLRLKVYDKNEEITDSGKQYIRDWHQYKGSSLFRIEFTIKWEQFKEWISYLQASDCPNQWKRYIGEKKREIDPDTTAPIETIESDQDTTESHQDYLNRSLLCLLDLDPYKCLLWRFCADRVLYFRHRATKEVISMLDLTGWSEQATEPRPSRAIKTRTLTLAELKERLGLPTYNSIGV